MIDRLHHHRRNQVMKLPFRLSNGGPPKNRDRKQLYEIAGKMIDHSLEFCKNVELHCTKEL